VKFKIDENLPIEIAGLLRDAGYGATTVVDQGLGGSADPDIAFVYRNEDRVLVTLDMDFADIRTYPPNQHSGLIDQGRSGGAGVSAGH
jgi:predicted nuclease of predicted toxin-antitoxin system